MVHLLFALLVETRAAATNSTTSSCHPVASGGTTRTLWSILGSCALTLIICVWQAIHPDFPAKRTDDPELYWSRWDIKIITQIAYIFSAFLVPEAMVLFATSQWYAARLKWKELESRFLEAGYPWSITHCLFAEMNGFVYCDENGFLRTIDSLEFLELCRDKIANPVITEEEVEGLGKSDWLGKAVLVFQLLWFISQVGARHLSGFVVTLVELDTVCMAVLTVVLIFFWWKKPLRPTCPHIFYSPQCSKAVPLRTLKQEPWCPLLKQAAPSAGSDRSLTRVMYRIAQDHMKAPGRLHRVVTFSSLCAAWFVFGALHLTAWNFPFVTQEEKTAWRVTSVILTASPLFFILLPNALLQMLRAVKMLARRLNGLRSPESDVGFEAVLDLTVQPSQGDIDRSSYGGLIYGFITRLILVILMLISLRSLPCSAYEVVLWTSYIPHL